jgi:TrmH family RNA methyltransferase
MITKAVVKQYQSLKQKKFRQKYGLFIVEGVKMVNEAIESGVDIRHILYAHSESATYSKNENAFEVPQDIINLISSFKNPSPVIAVCEIESLPKSLEWNNWVLGLDGIRDPGNFGTMLRLADWYGFDGIYASTDCVELLNPKVVSASMGSCLRVPVIYTELVETISMSSPAVYAAHLNGEPHRQIEFPKTGMLVIGSESHGVSNQVLELENVSNVFIPSKGNAESLNAAIACGIIMDQIAG